ncbi:MAG: winged helix-turn-helix domain-containing protein [Candidatus Komeilibacteria bacterium]|nr:winged helix-turn-helix domain-containing protein [Candidatus Komeilibacteria bacterium]
MLEQLFSSRTREKLLKLFLFNPEKRYYVREITRLVDERLNSVRRELANLDKFNLIKSEDYDRRKYYYLNKKFVLLTELTNLFVKARLLWEQRIMTAAEKYEGLKYLSLLGFFVNDEQAKTDLLLIGRLTQKDLNAFIREIEKITMQPVRYTHFTTLEYNNRQSLTDKFLYDLLERKAIILLDKITKRR